MARIEFGEFDPAWAGQWANIRDRRGWAAAKAIESKALVLKPNAAGGAQVPGQNGTYTGVIDLVEQGLATLESSITAWSLEHPLTREAFLSDQLDEDLIDWLISTIEAYYTSTQRTSADRLTLAGSSTALSE